MLIFNLILCLFLCFGVIYGFQDIYYTEIYSLEFLKITIFSIVISIWAFTAFILEDNGRELNLRMKLILYFSFVSLVSVVSMWIFCHETEKEKDLIDYIIIFFISLAFSSLFFAIKMRYIFMLALPAIRLYEIVTKTPNPLISERKEQQEILHEWELEADAAGNEAINNLSFEARKEMETLKNKYIHNPSAKTTLALAKFYEKNGVKSLSNFYYDQLFAEYRWAKETRELQKSRNAR